SMLAIVAGANDFMLPTDINAVIDAIAKPSSSVRQFESPIATIEHVVAVAKAYGVTVLINPAPARRIGDEMLEVIRFLVPNRQELAGLTGLPTDIVADVEVAAKTLLLRGAQNVIVTLGR